MEFLAGAVAGALGGITVGLLLAYAFGEWGG